MSVVYKFGDFRLDCGNFELLRAGREVNLERKPMELLVLLSSRQGQLVTRSDIAEHLWSSEIHVDTEHGINTAVRKLRLTLRDDPAEPKFIKTVTGMGYRFVAPVTLESPIPLPEIDAVSAPVELSAPVEATTVHTRIRRTGWIVAIIVIFITSLSFVRAYVRRRSAAPSIRSLAVLPLDNFSGDPAQDYLAAGMTDELTTMIARNSTLQVTSRTSVMQYKGAHRPLSEIARALGVDGIVEGSVARKGDRMHMTLQLIRSDTDSHVWAESFDRDANDTLLAQEAAQVIAKELHRAIPAASAQPYLNPAAHDAYLHGKYLWFSEHMAESGAYFRRAIEIQPDYAEAWAGLADYYGEGVAGDVLDPRTALAQEEQAAKRALELAPDLAAAHVSMAAYYLIGRWDTANADRESLHGLALSPRSAEILYFRSCVLLAMRRFPEAIEAAEKSVELAPYERPVALAVAYSFSRQYDAALSELHLRLEASPSNEDLLDTLSDIWRRKGNYKEAVDAWARARIAGGDSKAAAGAREAYARNGARGFIQWQLVRREKDAKSNYVSPVELASYHAQLSEREPTLSLLEEGYGQRAADIRWLQDDPAYDFLETEPRFRSILSGLGKPLAE